MTGSLSPSLAASQTQILPPAVQQQAMGSAFGNIGSLGQAGPTGFQQYFPGGERRAALNIYNNPFAPTAQAGANTAMTMGEGAATNQFNLGGNLETLGENISGAAQPLIQDANQVFQMGLDPQQKLYNRYLQLMQQQTQAQNAQSGVGSTPYAAGINAQNNDLFQIQWNAQQQANAVNALTAASGAYGTAGNLATAGAGISQAGAGLQAGAAPLFMQSAMYPYSISTLMSNQGMQALQQLLGYGQAGSGLTQTQIADYLSLLGLVPQQQQANTNAALAQNTIQKTGFDELIQLGTAAGKSVGFVASGGLSNLGSAFGVPGSNMFTPGSQP